MAEAGANMESWFNWEEHFLDVLLLFWISVGLLIVGISNSLTQFFGPLQPRVSWDKGRDGLSPRSVVEGPIKPESTFWLNQALNWVYLHYNSLPEFVDAWILALNDQAVKLGCGDPENPHAEQKGPVQIKFEKVESGSLPPKFGEVTYDAGPEDKYVLNSRVDSRDLSFAVFASQQTHEGVKLTNLTVTVLKLRGHLKIQCYRKKNDMMADVGFQGRPDIKVQGKPANPYQDPSDLVDVGVCEEVVRNTICLTSTTFNVSQWIGGLNRQCEVIPVQRTMSSEMRRSTEPQPPSSPRPVQPLPTQQLPQTFEPSKPVYEPQQVFESIEVQEAPKQHSALPPSAGNLSPEPLSPSSRQRFEEILQDLESVEIHNGRISPEPEPLPSISPQSFESNRQMFDYFQDLETIEEQSERATPESQITLDETHQELDKDVDFGDEEERITPEPECVIEKQAEQTVEALAEQYKSATPEPAPVSDITGEDKEEQSEQEVDNLVAEEVSVIAQSELSVSQSGIKDLSDEKEYIPAKSEAQSEIKIEDLGDQEEGVTPQAEPLISDSQQEEVFAQDSKDIVEQEDSVTPVQEALTSVREQVGESGQDVEDIDYEEESVTPVPEKVPCLIQPELEPEIDEAFEDHEEEEPETVVSECKSEPEAVVSKSKSEPEAVVSKSKSEPEAVVSKSKSEPEKDIDTCDEKEDVIEEQKEGLIEKEVTPKRTIDADYVKEEKKETMPEAEALQTESPQAEEEEDVWALEDDEETVTPEKQSLPQEILTGQVTKDEENKDKTSLSESPVLQVEPVADTWAKEELEESTSSENSQSPGELQPFEDIEAIEKQNTWQSIEEKPGQSSPSENSQSSGELQPFEDIEAIERQKAWQSIEEKPGQSSPSENSQSSGELQPFEDIEAIEKKKIWETPGSELDINEDEKVAKSHEDIENQQDVQDIVSSEQDDDISKFADADMQEEEQKKPSIEKDLESRGPEPDISEDEQVAESCEGINDQQYVQDIIASQQDDEDISKFADADLQEEEQKEPSLVESEQVGKTVIDIKTSVKQEESDIVEASPAQVFESKDDIDIKEISEEKTAEVQKEMSPEQIKAEKDFVDYEEKEEQIPIEHPTVASETQPVLETKQDIEIELVKESQQDIKPKQDTEVTEREKVTIPSKQKEAEEQEDVVTKLDIETFDEIDKSVQDEQEILTTEEALEQQHIEPKQINEVVEMKESEKVIPSDQEAEIVEMKESEKVIPSEQEAEIVEMKESEKVIPSDQEAEIVEMKESEKVIPSEQEAEIVEMKESEKVIPSDQEAEIVEMKESEKVIPSEQEAEIVEMKESEKVIPSDQEAEIVEMKESEKVIPSDQEADIVEMKESEKVILPEEEDIKEDAVEEVSSPKPDYQPPADLETLEVQQWTSSPGPKRQPPVKVPIREPSPDEPAVVTEEVVEVQMAPTQESVHSIETREVAEPQACSTSQQAIEPTAPVEEETDPQPVEVVVEGWASEGAQDEFHVPTVTTPPKQLPQRPQPQRLGSEKRLLTKVIKASGLNQNAGSVDPYCVVYVDTPPQNEVTSVVRSTFNPFWDEQFYFDLTKDSQMVRFEILDRHRPNNDNFLGEAIVYCEDLQRNPSSRQIIPLQGRNGDFATGSITVEFLCSDPADTVNMTDAISPRRTIETSKAVTPEGTVITTTTTTTQKPHNSRLDANIDSPPSYVEKRGFEYEPIDPDRSSSEVIRINGVESVADTAIRALSDRPKQRKTPVKTSTLIITGVKRTIESSPTDEEDVRYLTTSSAGSPEVAPPREQIKEKKSFASRIKKRFSRSKKRSQSADRARSTSSLREGSNYLRPPSGPQSKDDMEIYRKKKDQPETPNLKKSKSLGGSLKKLFRRSRKRSRSLGRGEQSRESSVSRQSRHTSQVPSREGSLTRSSHTTGHNTGHHQDTVIL